MDGETLMGMIKEEKEKMVEVLETEREDEYRREKDPEFTKSTLGTKLMILTEETSKANKKSDA